MIRKLFESFRQYTKKEDEKNWKDELRGGLADKNKPEDFDPIQLAKGIKVELEHTDSIHIATEVAMDHISEIPDYYDRLEKVEPAEKD